MTDLFGNDEQGENGPPVGARWESPVMKQRRERALQLQREQERAQAQGAARKDRVLDEQEARRSRAIAWLRERLIGRLLAGAPHVSSDDAREEWRARDPEIFNAVSEREIFGAVFHDKRFRWTGSVGRSSEPSHNGRIIRLWALAEGAR